MGRADLHIHTRVSDGLGTIEQVLEFVEHRTALDVVAITDHEDVTGGLRAREVAAKRGYRFEVVAGAEVTSLQGHILALFIERDVPSFRSVEATLERIHLQGGLAIAPHPLSWLTRSVSERTLDRIERRGEAGIAFDGIELSNPSPAGRRTGARAARLNAARWRLPWVGGSDAHHLPHIGTGWTEYDGVSAEDLRSALQNGRVRGGMARYPHARDVGYSRIAMGLAWGYSATPRKMLGGKWRAG